MTTAKEIEAYLFSRAPKEYALDWDNVGLLTGRFDRGVQKVMVALDVTEGVVEEADRWGADLIVAHHPVIFHGVKSVTEESSTGRVLIQLLECGIAAICMHTNLDIAPGGVNDMLAAALGIQDTVPLGADGCGRIGTLPEEAALEPFLSRVYDALHCTGLRYVDAGKPVRRVAVGGGACWDYHGDAVEKGCDTFVTSDLKYHDFLEARALGLNVVDAGHFPTEDVVCAQLMHWLTEGFPELKIKKSESHREVFSYFKK